MAKKIGVVGCGLVGRAWSIVFARGGYDVALFDPVDGAAEAAVAFARSVLPDLEANDLLRGQKPDAVMARLKPVTSIEAALKDAFYVQESAFEQVDVKKELFGRLDKAAAPDTILGSSTSAILPSVFTKDVPGRHRCIVVHPINPPYLVPAAEIVPAPWTSPDVVARTRALMIELGQKPIMMKKEIDGFVMNRMQGALLQEAFRLVAEGYATAEDIDVGIADGIGLRWSFIGPFEVGDLNAPKGIREYIDRYEGLYKTLWKTQQHVVEWGGKLEDEIEKERIAKLPRDKLEERQRWRDRRLMSLVAGKRRADKDIGR